MSQLTKTVRRFLGKPSRAKLVLPRLQVEIFQEGLEILHETLASTALDGKYWINGGLLLGYVREGKPLSHDPDADFSVWDKDRSSLLEGIEKLLQAGFQKRYRWVNSAGEVTEWSLLYRGIPYEFFIMSPVDGMMQWTCYAGRKELICQAPVHGLEDFELFGRTWKKPDDHETYLRALYGDWEIPNPNYCYETDSQAIVRRIRWKGNKRW